MTCRWYRCLAPDLNEKSTCVNPGSAVSARGKRQRGWYDRRLNRSQTKTASSTARHLFCRQKPSMPFGRGGDLFCQGQCQYGRSTHYLVVPTTHPQSILVTSSSAWFIRGRSRSKQSVSQSSTAQSLRKKPMRRQRRAAAQCPGRLLTSPAPPLRSSLGFPWRHPGAARDWEVRPAARRAAWPDSFGTRILYIGRSDARSD